MDDRHKQLRHNVNLLGKLLGEVLQEQEGKQLFTRVEQVRKLAKSLRKNKTHNFQELSRLLKKLSNDESLKVARAFTHFLQLSNVAEEQHRIRRRREHQLHSSLSKQSDSFAQSFKKIFFL